MTTNASNEIFETAHLDAVCPQTSFDYVALWCTFKRCRWPLSFWLLFCLSLACIYLYVTPAEYMASAQIALETPRKQRIALDADGEPIPIDSAQADTRIQIIKSERLLRFVFNTLDLGKNFHESPSLLGKVSALVLGPQPPLSAEEKSTLAFLDFMDRVDARRMGLSYAITISYRSASAQESARLANAVADAFIRDLVLSGPDSGAVLQRSIVEVSRDAAVLLTSMKAGSVPDTPILGLDGKIIGAAMVPLKKSSPHTSLALLLALSVGLSIAAGCILVLHSRDQVLRSPRDAARLFGPDLLAVVEAPASSGGRPTKMGDVLAKLPSGGSRYFELAVASWDSGDSATGFAEGLSTALAAHYATVLLRPTIPAGVDAKAILDGLERPSRRTRAVEPGKATPPGLTTIAGGFTHDGTGWLNDTVSRQSTLSAIKARGHLIVDLGPLVGSYIAKSLSRDIAGAVVVIEQGRTTIAEATSASDTLKKAGARIAGYVMVVPETSRSPAARLLDRSMVALRLAGARLVPLASGVTSRVSAMLRS